VWSLSTIAYTLPRPSEQQEAHISQGQGVQTLHVKGQHTRHHAPVAACKLRSEHWRKPQRSLRRPSTGATGHFASARSPRQYRFAVCRPSGPSTGPLPAGVRAAAQHTTATWENGAYVLAMYGAMACAAPAAMLGALQSPVSKAPAWGGQGQRDGVHQGGEVFYEIIASQAFLTALMQGLSHACKQEATMSRQLGCSAWTDLVSTHMPPRSVPQARVVARWRYGRALPRSVWAAARRHFSGPADGAKVATGAPRL